MQPVVDFATSTFTKNVKVGQRGTFSECQDAILSRN